MSLAMLAGVIVIILLQVALLLRSKRSPEEDLRWHGLQEAQEKGIDPA